MTPAERMAHARSFREVKGPKTQKGLRAPPLDPIAKAQKLAVPDDPERERNIVEPATSFLLKRDNGAFELHKPKPDYEPRLVVEGELDELIEWGLPQWRKRYPRCTVEGMVPFLRMCCLGGAYRYLRTPNVQGLFTFQRLPWEPLGVVWDIGVFGKPAGTRDGNTQFAREVADMWRAGRDWAKTLRAARFRYEICSDFNAETIAERVGFTERAAAFDLDLT